MRVHLSWPGLAGPDVEHFEVRRGTGWLAEQVAYRGREAECEVDANLGAETFSIRARNRAGHLSETTQRVLVTTPVPNGWTAVTGFPRDEVALTWPGTLTGVEVSGGVLQLAAGRYAGTYQTPNLDAGTSVRARWTAILDAWQQDLGFLGSEETYLGGSTYARERTGEGVEPTALFPGIDLDTLPSDLPGSPDLYPDWLGRGHRDDVGKFVQARLEVAFSDDAVDWSAWATMAPQERKARYVRFRVTLSRSHATDYQVQVRALTFGAALEIVPAESMAMPTLATSFLLRDDFTSGAAGRYGDTNFVPAQGGTAGIFVGDGYASGEVDANHWGAVFQFCGGTGETPVGDEFILLRREASSMVMGGGLVCEWLVRFASIEGTPGSNSYGVYRVGLGDSTVYADHVDGIYFEVDPAAASVFRMCTAANSSRTKTAGTGSSVAANTWYLLRLEVSAAGTSVQYFVNGESIGTVATNIPGSGRDFGLMCHVSAVLVGAATLTGNVGTVLDAVLCYRNGMARY